MVPIKEYYVVDKECKGSVRYRPRNSNSPLAGMTVYIPRSVLKSEIPPATLLLSLEQIDPPISSMGRENFEEEGELA